MTEDIIKNDLFETSEEKYGKLYNENLMKQYEKYVDLMDKTSERRGTANNYLITINSALVGIMSIFSNITNYPIKNILFLMIITSLFGILLSFCWEAILNSYKNLNDARFCIIHLMEEKLPAKLFHAEWKYINEVQKKKDKYNPLSHLEKNIPYMFIAFYALFIIYNFYILSTIST